MSAYPEQVRSGIVLSLENLARHIEGVEAERDRYRELLSEFVTATFNADWLEDWEQRVEAAVAAGSPKEEKQ